jgi:thiamine-monophosphate kinase
VSLTEFEIIREFFERQPVTRDDVVVGIGDDAAVLRVPPDQLLLSCTDTLVEGVHFTADLAAEHVGHRALACSLSDIAAMGGEPAWALLSLTLPEADPQWLRGFAAGLFALAARYRVVLVGGDITRGPLTISLQLHGLTDADTLLTRSGAQPGDAVCVTGYLGDAAAALASPGAASSSAALRYCRERYCRPQPRMAAGRKLRGKATACIDVSDGLLADLNHVLQASGCGATVDLASLPLSAECIELMGAPRAAELALRGGDDYELCFAAANAAVADLTEVLDCRMSVIGRFESAPGLRLRSVNGEVTACTPEGYRHF